MTRVFFSLLVCLSVGYSGRALAQTTFNGSVRGYVTDEQGAILRDVAVTASSSTVAETSRATSDQEGAYRLIDLPPGTYTITAEAPGFATLSRENVRIRAGLNLTLDLTLAVGGVSESAEVRAETPMLEQSTAVQALNISGELQRSLPLSSRRNWFDFMFLAPGTLSTVSATGGGFWVHGSDFGSHVITIDGADVAAAGQSSNTYILMSSEVLQDVQVTTSGIQASAPLGQGAVMNIVTQSGTNVLHGASVLTWQREDWSANNNPGGTTSAFDLVQPEISLGGPVWRERAWFFGSYRFTEFENGISRTPEQLALARALVPGFEPFNSDTTSHQVFAKVTTRLTPKHQLQVFDQYGMDRSWSAGATDTRQSRQSALGGNVVSAAVSSVWRDNLTSRAGVVHSNATNWDLRFANPDDPSRPVHAGTFLSSGRRTGTGALVMLDNLSCGCGQDSDDHKLTFTADATLYKTGWIGSHELQAGVYVQPGRIAEFTSKYVNGGYVLEDLVLLDRSNPGLGTMPFHRRVYDVDRYQFRNNSTDDYAVYVQDAWRPSDRVTVSAGVRIDAINRRDRIFDQLVQDVIEVGPRLGVNVQLTGDGRNIARASWGRVHDAISSNTRYGAGSVTAGYADTYDNDLDGVFETTFTTAGTTAVNLSRRIDPTGFRQAHNNDLLVGYVHQFPGQLSVDASMVRREFRNRVATVDENGIYVDGQFLGYRDENFTEIVRLTSNVWNWPVYTALQLQMVKQSERLQVVGNYTRQLRHMEGTWQPNDPASFIQPEAFANDKGVGDVLRAETINSLSGTDLTTGGQWRDHTARLAATYRAPWNLLVAANYTLQTGRWSGPVVTQLDAPDPRLGPPTLTLSNGNRVSNPLATLIRFAGSDRGEGQVKSPTVHILNLRVARELSFGGVRIEPAVDVLNITNHDANQSLLSSANQLYSPNFGLGTSRQPPRSFQLSARVTF